MIYAIWECDAHQSNSSLCFKGFFTNVKIARRTYKKWAKKFKQSADGWILNFGVYRPDIRLEANSARDFEVIESTEQ